MSKVIKVDFRPAPGPEPLFELSASCQVLYADEHVTLIRNHFVINGRAYIQHVCQGVGIDV